MRTRIWDEAVSPPDNCDGCKIVQHRRRNNPKPENTYNLYSKCDELALSAANIPDSCTTPLISVVESSAAARPKKELGELGLAAGD